MERRESKRLDRRQDGFGTRSFDPRGGRIEVLDLAPTLAMPELEEKVRTGALGSLHASGEAHFHGALTPAHVVVQKDGVVALTGWAYADALAALELTREELWREFGLAMPPAPDGPVPGRQSDVVQAACLVLGLFLRRMVCGEDYLDRLSDLVVLAARPVDTPQAGSGLQNWLRRALRLDAGEPFESGADAAGAFTAVDIPVVADAGRPSLEDAVRQMSGEIPPLPLRPLLAEEAA